MEPRLDIESVQKGSRRDEGRFFALSDFKLEDFFFKYEHSPGLINLASSDVQPWSWRELARKCPRLSGCLKQMDFRYPDIAGALLKPMQKALRLPPGKKVFPTNGAEESLFLVLGALRNRYKSGPLISFPELGFGSYAGISRYLGFKVSTIKCDPTNDWRISEEALFNACAKSRIVAIANPNNPTGAIIPKETLRQAAKILAKKDGVLLVDEVFAMPGEYDSVAALGENVVVVGSLSKVYGLPGIRLGWTLAEPGLIATMQTLQQYTTLSLNSFSVVAGTHIMNNLRTFTRQEDVGINRRYLINWCHTVSAIRLIDPEAGTTAVLQIESKLSEDRLFRNFKSKGVLLVPGSKCFGFSGKKPWFRLGYGGNHRSLAKGLEILGNIL